MPLQTGRTSWPSLGVYLSHRIVLSRRIPMNPPDISLPIELSDDKVLLRLLREQDVDALFAAVNESIDELEVWMPWCADGYTRDCALSFVSSQDAAWKEGREYSFAIIDRPSGKLLGGCGLNHFDWQNRRANMGYWVRNSARARGVAPAAARLVAEFGFRKLELDRIEVIAATENLASQRVAEKIGAVREGVARKRYRVGSKIHDAIVFSLVRDDLGL
jgi:ribosomal-protein-serine acetyltransferase